MKKKIDTGKVSINNVIPSCLTDLTSLSSMFFLFPLLILQELSWLFLFLRILSVHVFLFMIYKSPFPKGHFSVDIFIPQYSLRVGSRISPWISRSMNAQVCYIKMTQSVAYL